MYGDFSRLTHSRGKQFTAVWSQQGRVALDADANEQTAILLDWLRTLAVDFIGPFGGHIRRAGFLAELSGDELTLSSGHYYVHGLRCEIPKPDPAHPGPGYVVATEERTVPPYLVALLVWERSVSAIADPDLLEPGLGPHPPDTTVRSQVAWTVLVRDSLPVPRGTGTPLAQAQSDELTTDALAASFEEYNTRTDHRPRLAARAERAVETADQTIVPTTSGYLGVENQLYRVEVHDGGPGPAPSDDVAHHGGPTFKWSRDNGSAEFGVVISGPETTAEITVASLGRDARTGLDVGDWVELIDDGWAPFGHAPPLRSVTGIVGTTVTLDATVHLDPARHPFLRRWDQPGASGGERGIPIVGAHPDGSPTWIELEDGVQICFGSHPVDYERGDYWLIPARAATGGVLWPGGAEPRFEPRQGPDRFLAPLALVQPGGVVEDRRVLFTHLAWSEPDHFAGPGPVPPSPH